MRQGALKLASISVVSPDWLRDYFGLDFCLSFEARRSLGLQVDLEGYVLVLPRNEGTGNRRCWRSRQVTLPMGWSWAFRAVQTMHVRFSPLSGPGPDETLVAGWPAPELTADGLALPYVRIFDATNAVVQRRFDALAGVLRANGFRLHEIELAGLVSTVLEMEVGNGWARPEASKILLSEAALLKLAAPEASCSGDSMRELLGHFG